MAINLDKIKERLNKLSGQGKGQQRKDLWGPPDDGKPATVRIIPWQDGNNGDPFKERWFYYGIGKGRSIPAPFQYGKPDPISELRKKLYEEATKESIELAGKLKPQRRFYAPVIVRGLEAEGPKLWPFSKTVSKSLYNEMMDEEIGDITDVNTGYDIKVIKEKAQGQQWSSATAKTVKKSTQLLAPANPSKEAKAEVTKKIDEWIKVIPNLDEIFPQMTYDEVEKRMNDYINGDEQKTSDGTEGVGRSQAKTTEGPAAGSDQISDTEHGTLESAFAELGDLVESDDADDNN